ncbi:hypothetical protein BDR06DRAFT_1037554 [Suillus hirtellus]|nr:hypothetical protein BDR06DRAFT_1037554 [Suillus hirtellus]
MSEDVDKFKDDVHLCPGEWSIGNESQAAKSTSGSENTVHVFEQTGIFLSACWHGIIQALTEMRHSEELAKDPLATINKLIDVFGDHLGIGSDIGCTGNHHLILAVNAFHGHTHNRKCQLQHHLLYLRWFILNNHKQVLTMISDYTKELKAYCATFPGQGLDFESRIAEELAYLEAVAVEPVQDATAVEYVEALEKLDKYQAAFEASCNNQFVSYMPSSFRPDSGLSQDALHVTKQGHAVRHATEQHLQVQINLEGLVVQHMFELSKANLASTGYKLWKQISKAIVKHPGTILSALDKYNKLTVSQNPQWPMLQYSEVMSYAALSDNGTHHKMANKYFKIIRAQEEITQLNVEIQHLQAWWMATELDSTDTLLAAELQSLFNCQRRINYAHCNHLACIYSLPGYTSSIPLQVNAVVTGSENEEECDLMLEGKQSAWFESCIQQISQ